MSDNGGGIIVLVVVWGFLAYFIYHYLPAAFSSASSHDFLGSIIKFLW